MEGTIFKGVPNLPTPTRSFNLNDPREPKTGGTVDVYETLKNQLKATLGDLRILSGDEIGPSDSSWQDVAGTAALNLRAYADMLDSLRKGETHLNGRFRWSGGVCFPSIELDGGKQHKA